MPPERRILGARASRKVCHAFNQRRLHHDAPLIAAYFRDRHLTLVDADASGPTHFPQGGWTECWDVLAGEGHVRVNIGTSLERVREVVRRLHAAMP